MSSFKRIFIFFLIFVVFTLDISFAVNTNEYLEKEIKSIIEWKRKNLNNAKSDKLFDSLNSEVMKQKSLDWYAIAIGRAGIDDDYKTYCTINDINIDAMYSSPDLDITKATEWHRNILARRSLNCGEYKKVNFIADGVYNRKKFLELEEQGINGLIWALIAIDSGLYSDDGVNIREQIINKIISRQKGDGGFSLNPNEKESNVDLTAMAMISFAPYYSTGKNEKISVDKSIEFLSKAQSGNGGFKSWGVFNAESASQVIIALSSLGIDPLKDDRFIKEGKTVLDFLKDYKKSDGGYIHAKDNTESNSMASEQVLCAYISLYRFYNGYRRIYDMRDEFNYEQKKNISKAIKSIKAKSKDADESIKKVEDYDKSYIYNLSDYKKEYVDLKKVNNKNRKYKYAVVNIFEKKEKQKDKSITYNEKNEARILIEKAEISDLVKLKVMYDKVKNIDELLATKLKNKISELERRSNQVKLINDEILKTIFPLDEITTKDKKKIESIVSKIEKLPQEDKKFINNKEELDRAVAIVKVGVREYLLKYSLIFVVVALVFFIVYRIKKRKQDED